ncbi:translation initiation factor IF-2 [Pelagibacterium xiamenense]|uniref:translation initiation factor IF-2 n=1 Tax=Pelagibacterium xiamenense TaxID=2901140 RepID=UPI001E5049B1|nr:translation initiation factor IF-2 [Pelagibacterium xiamenense]MCD7058687.1 translation initiation factor IF-2 [Pelagibacterium xiamenense]
MSDKDNTSDNSGSGKKTLTLKGAPNVGAKPGMSRSSRTVVVEKRTRRVGGPGAGAPQSAPGGGRPQGGQRPGGRPQPGSPRSNAAPSGKLTQSEAQARERALREAAARADEDKRKAEEEARRLAEIDARRKAEREEAERKAAEEAARQAQQEAEPAAQAKDDLEEIVPVKAGQARPKPAHRPSPKAAQPDMPPPPPPGEGEDDRIRRRAAPAPKALVDRDELERAKRSAAPKPSTQPSRRDGNSRGRLNVNSALADNDGDRGRSLASMRRRQNKKMGKVAKAAQPKISREVTLPEAITVAELANRMSERAVDVIKLLMGQGQMLKINDVIDADTAELVATELGHTVKRVSDSDVEEGLFEEIGDSDEADLAPRPAVVTIMGHVDHGKTSLLDAIREAKVVDTEAGGITQHIGAYQVEKNGQKITFLDTPGHEAFTAMRARGAQATDIAVLVVAADDSVMPQTIESIKHAKAAGVPLIVAINKIDKPGADANKVRTELLQHEVFVESMGGEVLDVEVSALKKTNLDGLLEAILLQAEVAELKAPEKGSAQGLVIESKLDKGRGAVATVLVQRGTLNVGDILVAGTEWAKVRALIDDKGRQVKSAGPSTPVEVLGFSGVPDAGDRFAVVENEARAREITEYRQRTIREKTAGGGATSLEQMMQQLKDSDISKVPLVIKGDVQGSVEAIVTALNKLSTDEVSAQILYSGVGGITESDVTLATASKAVIIGFNVRANKQAAELASREGIEIRYYNVIYDLIDDVKKAMSGLLEPEVRETFIGYAEILEVFNISKVGKVAGCRVTEGTVERGAGVRLLRDNVVIHEGKLSTLKRFKDEVKDVPAGQECGMAFERYEDMRPGDVIECYRVEKVQRTL